MEIKKMMGIQREEFQIYTPHDTPFVLPFNCEAWRSPIQRKSFLK
jgi:hypothetical protein